VRGSFFARRRVVNAKELFPGLIGVEIVSRLADFIVADCTRVCLALKVFPCIQVSPGLLGVENFSQQLSVADFSVADDR
jgi:hypothetical protein